MKIRTIREAGGVSQSQAADKISRVEVVLSSGLKFMVRENHDGELCVGLLGARGATDSGWLVKTASGRGLAADSHDSFTFAVVNPMAPATGGGRG